MPSPTNTSIASPTSAVVTIIEENTGTLASELIDVFFLCMIVDCDGRYHRYYAVYRSEQCTLREI